MKNKILFSVFCFMFSFTGWCQLYSGPTFDVPQEIEEAISTATGIYNTVKTVANDVQKFEELYKKVNDGIKTYHQVKSIISNTAYTINAINSGLNYLKTAKNLTPSQIANMVMVYKYYLDQLTKYMQDLTNFILEVFNMPDNQRIDAIDGIALELQQVSTNVSYVDNKIKVADMTLGSQKQDLQDVKDYYTALAADEASKTDTPESAAKNLSGIYGDIAKFMYALSAIIALVGAVKVYGQFTSGSDQVWQTCVSWFGACLALVTLTTFINILF